MTSARYTLCASASSGAIAPGTGVTRPAALRTNSTTIVSSSKAGARDKLPHRIHDERVAVKHELILPADAMHVHDRQAHIEEARAHHRFSLALLVNLVRRGVDDDEELRSGRTRKLRSLGRPDVLAHEQPDAKAVVIDHRRLCARVKVALLVKHLVVRQLGLAMIGRDRAAGDQGHGIVDIKTGVFGIADDDIDAVDLGAQPLEPALDLAAKAAMEEQILRGVAREGELGKPNEVGVELLPRAARTVDDAVGIGLHVTDQKVDLREGHV